MTAGCDARRTVRLGRVVSPALRELRHTRAVVVGVVDSVFVLIQKKSGEREICSVVNLHLEDECVDIKGLGPEEIGQLIPEDACVEDAGTDFDRFRARLMRRVENEVLGEKIH